MSILAYFGYYGPIILFLSTILLLRDKIKWLIIYVLGSALNSFINHIIKGIIKQPRPSNNVHHFDLFSLEDKYSKHSEMGLQQYGMPSGHAQNVFFSLAFIHYALNNSWITGTYLIVAIITISQRVIYLNHTEEQVFAGAIIGLLLGYLCFIYGNYIVKSIISFIRLNKLKCTQCVEV